MFERATAADLQRSGPICDSCYTVFLAPYIYTSGKTLPDLVTLSDLQARGKTCLTCRLFLDLAALGPEGLGHVKFLGQFRISDEAESAEDRYGALYVDFYPSTKPRSKLDLCNWTRRLLSMWLYVAGERLPVRRHSRKAFTFIPRTHLRTERAVWKPEVTSTIEGLDSILPWLHNCDENHPQCSTSSTWIPTRLIEIGSLQQDSPPFIRLVSAQGLSVTEVRYTALSHCWGSKGQPFVLTKDHLHVFQRQIPFETLPKTFRDAILVTYKLGLKYLWIDSLCIVQDDPGDWSHEAATMDSVYKHAYVTLAATASSDGTQGLFHTRHETVGLSISLNYEQASNCSIVPPYELLIKTSRASTEALSQAPLSQRGWTLQEILLSRRVVHFTSSQLIWQCRTSVQYEDNITTEQRNDVPTPEAPLYTIYHCWWKWVEDYAQRKLTKKSDKMAALAGLTKYMQERTNDEPILGLWKNNLSSDLLWQRNTAKPIAPTRDHAFPTWTWMSLDAPPRNVFSLSSNYVYTSSFELLHASVSWDGEPLTSTIRSSRLELRAKVIHCTFHHEPRGWWGYDASKYTIMISGSHGRETDPTVTCTFDRLERYPGDLDAYCILIGQTWNGDHYPSSRHMLIATPVTPDGGTFARLGVAELSIPNLLTGQVISLDPFRDIEPQVVILQ
ncbi:HET-domain-containing protein [Bimuria novae-zelandiae CBS 107.79]|uniref:HET-domain-containing protein n=1 Tax=Bimuria novae-zelandiae CBS 107.79 TaxID=1447943 RepID=A0A6A5V838_9PLEO|nr:HET-domain-containing protein [Bimuria novae-zelandiae CBS 107.79]